MLPFFYLKQKPLNLVILMMIKLRPISGEQTFSIIPSFFNTTTLGSATVVLKETGTNQSDDSATFTVALSSTENYVEVSLTP